VFTLDQSGGGQGHVYKITAAGAQVLAGPGAAVTAGDVVTIYCSGLGEVTPATVTAGSPSPLDVLENTTNKVTASIDGVFTPVLFCGPDTGIRRTVPGESDHPRKCHTQRYDATRV